MKRRHFLATFVGGLAMRFRPVDIKPPLVTVEAHYFSAKAGKMVTARINLDHLSYVPLDWVRVEAPDTLV